VSWRAISREELDRMTPVSPPTVNRKMNPRAHIAAGVNVRHPEPCRVASQLNTLMPVGTAIIIVAAVK